MRITEDGKIRKYDASIRRKHQLSRYIDRVKTFVLIFLMVLCVIQVGILWSSRSVPFYLSNILGTKLNSRTSIEDETGKYLLPYRIVLSAGFDDDHYIIKNGSSDYHKLWDGARRYMSTALNNEPKKIEAFNEDAWGGLVAKKPYTFEFGTQIPIEIIKWVLDLKATAGKELTGIYKMVICPDDPDNSYADTIYIRDNSNIYTYEIADFKGEALSQGEFLQIYQRQNELEHARNYQVAIERYRKADIKITLDMLGPFTQKSSEEYPAVEMIPFVSADGREYEHEDLKQISWELFGERSDYDYDVDNRGSVIFKKADSVYRLYKSSVLEYKYIGSQVASEKTDIVEAYKKAIEFIIDRSSQNDIMSNLNVYLKSIEEKGNTYVFNFDYSVLLSEEKGEVPILLKNYVINEGDRFLNNGISIEATSRRVSYCQWLAVQFKPQKNIPVYSWSFPDMHAKAFDIHEELNNQEISVKDFGIYYVLSERNQREQKIEPSFVLFTADGNYDVPLQASENN